MISKGQEKALYQLKRIQAASKNGFNIHKISEPTSDGQIMFVHIDVDCSKIVSTEGGLKLRKREKFVLNIPTDFPFAYPSVYVNHKRFDGFSHVQWVRHLCLYLSPSTEWDISDGMYGYIYRLHQWLIKAAINEHEGEGQPLHPPAVYAFNSNLPSVIIRKNTPKFDGKFWFGFGILSAKNNQRIDLLGWQKQMVSSPDGTLNPAILLSERFPFEYPNKAEDLFDQLSKQGISLELIHLLILFSVYNSSESDPLYLIIGTPMRGIKGKYKHQHLAVWSINEVIKETVKLEIKCSELRNKAVNEELKQKINSLNNECKNNSIKALKMMNMRWCPVKEDRPEIVIRRDHKTSASWFYNKSIAIWGCGALGSYIAEIVVRSGISNLILRDNKRTHPGILVRQNYEDADIGFWKSDRLKERLLRINPNLDIKSDTDDFSKKFDEIDELNPGEGNYFDLIIDATASNIVHLKLEEFYKSITPKLPLVSMMIGSSASCAILSLIPPNSTGGIADIVRKIKIETCLNTNMGNYAEEFWPSQTEFLNFQPEPGCSDPTFIGSSIDMMILVGSMMNKLGQELLTNNFNIPRSYLMSKDIFSEDNHQLQHSNDKKVLIPDGYEVRFNKNSLNKMKHYINESLVIEDKVCETGGLLFGQIESATEIVWISEIIGPPEDSEMLPEKFQCGIVGTQEFNTKLIEKTQGSIQYIGMWHTHPVSAAIPSLRDINGMASIMCNDGFSSDSHMLVIIGYSSKKPQLGVYKYTTTEVRAMDAEEINIVFNQNGSIVEFEEE